jgi:hypothetical protein
VNEDEQPQKWPPWAFASLVFVIAVLVLVIAAVLVALFVSKFITTDPGAETSRVRAATDERSGKQLHPRGVLP